MRGQHEDNNDVLVLKEIVAQLRQEVEEQALEIQALKQKQNQEEGATKMMEEIVPAVAFDVVQRMFRNA